ncbi:MAG TPA: ATP synthase subunit F [Acholeplasmataceae bacterium]|nr:MAG: ATP synthase subunit F [Tenericutes bacterium GWA2_38_26]OHE30391.1 MAG: ATP synthase subunit F [Tenericutes bacterium GWC2_39_45]OHE31425.1 MAG: ATP synthase subunit F [Tenericutes bacterium GWD2_38_27]OHE39922.1 MAG: ATP synthase subunit F [Tenericutes bacterium GWE2_38_8]HBG32406.1 ATP synthase subunit F [Acholeplasmataceae bacterium]
MKFFLISDNVDTEVGMRLVGIDGIVVHEKNEFLRALEGALEDESIAIILVTTKLVELAPNIISELKLTQPRQLIVEIPDRHGTSEIGEAIDRYVSEAIGVKL